MMTATRRADARLKGAPVVSEMDSEAPVAFKENNPDSIDEPTVSPTRQTGAGTPAAGRPALGPDTLMASAANLRPVNLGAVATMLLPVLTYGTAAAAAAAIFAPGAVGSFIFGGAALSATNRALLQGAGAALIPTLVSKHQIKRAADTGILASPVYKQLVSACLLHGVLGLVVLSQAVSLRNPVLAATVGGLTGLATLTTSFTIMKIRESGQLTPSGRGMLAGVISLLGPANLTSAAYSVLTATMIAAGAMFFTSDPTTPCAIFYAAKDSVHVFACRITGAAALANAIVLFTVKQAADQGRQTSPLYRSLNASLATYSGISALLLLYGLVTGLAMPVGATYGYVGLLTAVALVTGYNWALGSK
ncbi:hypothetical protein GPECTOR_60g761 [Gonium pectorale]|uniref:Uncharacterized protein n=1 Tax=Gonium pectorale TaxID=33097 RepID=A0A150G5D2_GONPE|nr:hypothetical protein GPECTOR_60g761 [Gonium pectorale]|eukprot:KXZ44983.1 hypothetical protein GPECTOR_60g761 [Gonium pectorale]